MNERKLNTEIPNQIKTDDAKKRFNEILNSASENIPNPASENIPNPAELTPEKLTDLSVVPDKTPIDEYKNAFKKHHLTVVICYCDTDEHYVQDNIDKLPNGIELILCKSIASSEPVPDLKKMVIKSNNNNVMFAEYTYFAGKDESERSDYSINAFSFSDLRNSVKRLASRKFILMLDADERLSIDKSDLELIDKVATTKNNCGGFICNIASVSKMQNQTQRIIVGLCRIIINDATVYSYRVHEQISDNLARAGLGVIETTIVIRHIGYDDDNGNFIKKMYRNIGLLASDLYKKPDDVYLLDYFYRTAGTIFALENINFTTADEKSVQIETFLSDVNKISNYGIGLHYDLSGIYENIIGLAKMIEKNSQNLHALKEIYKLLCILHQLKIFTKKQV